MIEQPRTAPPQRINQRMLRLSRSSLRLELDRLDTPGSGDAFRVEERAPAQSAADSMPNTETVLHNSALCCCGEAQELPTSKLVWMGTPALSMMT